MGMEILMNTSALEAVGRGYVSIQKSHDIHVHTCTYILCMAKYYIHVRILNQ